MKADPPSKSEVSKTVAAVRHDLGAPAKWPPRPGGWPDQIELALLDAVFSLNARYGRGAENSTPATGVHRVVDGGQGGRSA